MDRKDEKPPVALDEMLCFAVYAAGHAFNQLYRPLLAELDLTYPQYLVMRVLWSGDNVSVREIGQMLHLQSNTLTPLLKRLEAMGLVIRARDPEDERSVRIMLTDRGRSMQDEAAHIPGCVAEASGLARGELADLTRQLRDLHERLNRVSTMPVRSSG